MAETNKPAVLSKNFIALTALDIDGELKKPGDLVTADELKDPKLAHSYLDRGALREATPDEIAAGHAPDPSAEPTLEAQIDAKKAEIRNLEQRIVARDKDEKARAHAIDIVQRAREEAAKPPVTPKKNT